MKINKLIMKTALAALIGFGSVNVESAYAMDPEFSTLNLMQARIKGSYYKANPATADQRTSLRNIAATDSELLTQGKIPEFEKNVRHAVTDKITTYLDAILMEAGATRWDGGAPVPVGLINDDTLILLDPARALIGGAARAGVQITRGAIKGEITAAFKGTKVANRAAVDVVVRGLVAGDYTIARQSYIEGIVKNALNTALTNYVNSLGANGADAILDAEVTVAAPVDINGFETSPAGNTRDSFLAMLLDIASR